MGAVRADGEDVLQQELPVARARTGVVERVLRPEAREFAQAPVDHERRALGGGRGERREGSQRQGSGADEPDARGSGAHRVVAHPGAPALDELVDRLHVPAGLRAAVATHEIPAGDIEGELPVLGAVHPFTLQLELVVGRIAVRDRKSTRLNSSHSQISYAVFCLKTKKIMNNT